MPSNSDHVSVVGYQVAGPSNAHASSSHRRPRRAAAPRRKAPPVQPQDIIEISDSDEEEFYEKCVVASSERRRTREGGGQVDGSPDRRLRAPLFLPDDDHDEDDAILALLNADDGLSVALPPASRSPQGKGKRRADVRPMDRYDSPLHLPVPLSAASSPPASQEEIMAPSRIPRLIAQVLEIVPDVDKSYLKQLIMLQVDSRPSVSGSNWGDDEALFAQIAEAILHTLFENAEYPKTHDKDRSAAVPHVRDPSPVVVKSQKARSSDGIISIVSTTTQTKENVDVTSGEFKVDAMNALGGGPHNEANALVAVCHPSYAAASGSSDRPQSQPTEPKQDPMSLTVAQVLEIVPDVEPTHLLKLIRHHLDVQNVDSAGTTATALDPYEVALQRVLHSLFETPNYPKVSRKRKRSSDEGAEEAVPAKARKLDGPDYTSQGRARLGGKYYDVLALNQLSQEFPSIPCDEVQRRFAEHNRLYAPTYLSLHAQRRETTSTNGTARSSGKKRKGKGKAHHDVEFEKERAWLVRKLQEDVALHGVEGDDGEGLECGCCFSTYPFSKMTQCPDTHLFCVDCVTNYAATLLGEHNHAISCMDQSGCKLLFAPSELRRILTPKLLELYERVSQRKELEAAGLENLEECPFCEYQVVIENEQEKLFRCEREECGAVSCRKCKKLDHLPKSCEEAAEDKKLDARHAIEEAMTAALMRNCPSCNKAFIKEAGCNKMVCPHCKTMSCYTCRKIINGYEHFNQAPPYNLPKDSRKCPLWESDTEQRHSEEVAVAARRAQEEYRRAHPGVNEADIRVDLPKAPPKHAVCNNPNHRHHHPPPFPAGLRAVARPVMGAPVPLHRAMGQAFLDLRMPPLPPLPPPLPLLPPPYNPAAAAAFAHVHPNAALAHPPMPVLAPPALPARLRRRHRHGAAPAPVPVAAPPPPALPVMPPPPPPQLLAHDPRRNPRRNAALAAEDMVRLAAGAGVLDAVVLGEGIHRPHRADKARGRPIRVERHR